MGKVTCRTVSKQWNWGTTAYYHRRGVWTAPL